MFGVNDGLVSNTCLVMGVAGAAVEPGIILLTGVAGLLAGAFSMAAGEFISMLSQKEMFEYQIGQEKDELERYPAEEAEELALIYAARGVPLDEARKITKKLIANPDQALDTLAREELGLNPDDLGSPHRRGDLLLHRLLHRREPAAHSVSVRIEPRRDHRRLTLRCRVVRGGRDAQSLLRQGRVPRRLAHAR